ncbi:hypothetical protein TcasGA2_TC032322 [Tribolium castaneum]|uniref:Uncharacterized protein n=1 Tax=Tribolium castaneum TaxID=7070 RepID=A0A139WLG2_TRICA|nr:hypothetical protein TcasGA2_TC032322 [Tribolium castaneum]
MNDKYHLFYKKDWQDQPRVNQRVNRRFTRESKDFGVKDDERHILFKM